MTHLANLAAGNLTGRKRYRSVRFGFFRPTTYMVLQVEVVMEKAYDLGGSGYYDFSKWTEWRDATVEDLTALTLD